MLIKFFSSSAFQVLPGLFVGSVRDSRDEEQIREHKITHILSIHDNPKRGTYDVSGV